MTSYKKISFAFALAMLFQITNCAQNPNISPTAIDILKEKYEHNIDKDEKIAPMYAQDHAPREISNKVRSHYFDTGLTRTKVTQEIKDGVIFTTTEKWITKHSSWATWSNMMLASITALIIGLGSFIRSVNDYDTIQDNKNLMSGDMGKYLYSYAQRAQWQKELRESSPLLDPSIMGSFAATASSGISAFIIIPLWFIYNYLSGQEELHKEIVEKETAILANELMALEKKN